MKIRDYLLLESEVPILDTMDEAWDRIGKNGYLIECIACGNRMTCRCMCEKIHYKVKKCSNCTEEITSANI